MANVPLKSIKFPGLDDTYTVPVVDSSLTQSGAAADAKVAGDKVGELKSAFMNTLVLYNFSPTITKGQRFAPTTGVQGSNSHFCRTGILPGIGTMYAVEMTNPNYTYQIVYYDATGATDGTGYLGCIPASGSVSGLTYLPPNAVKVGLNFYKGGANMQDSDKTAIQSALKLYCRTDKALLTSDVPADAYVTGVEITALKNDVSAVSVKDGFTNWTDPSNGIYVSPSNLTSERASVDRSRTSTNYQYASMYCKPGDVFIVSGNSGNYARPFMFVDADGYAHPTDTNWFPAQGTTFSGTRITAPTGAARIFVNRKYADGVDNDYWFRTIKQYAEDISEPANAGMTIVNMGDSIFGKFEGQGGDSESISHMIAEKMRVTALNCAFGGTHAKTMSGAFGAMDFESLATAIASGDFSAQEAYAETVSTDYEAKVAMLADVDFSKVDIVTVSYGTNDWHSNTTPTAYATALENGINTIQAAYPNLRVLLCTPMIRFADAGDYGGTSGTIIDSSNASMTNNNGYKLPDYVAKVEEIGVSLHIPVANNYNLGINVANHATFMHGLSNTDLVHPNVKGRRAIANNVIGALSRM